MTQDNGHTAGWRVQPRGALNQPIIVGEHVESGPGYRIASVHGVSGHPERTIAHARLIAAAPALLEALERVLPFIEEEADNRAHAGSEHSDYEREPRELADICRSAILQARGEAG